MSRIFFFDTETTGLPTRNKYSKTKFYQPEEIDKFDSSRIVSIAWIIYNDNDEIIIKKNFIVYPDNFVSHPQALKVHGITNDIAMNKGISIKTIFNEIKKDLQNCHSLNGYNVNFDYNVLLSECYRYHDKELINMIKNKNVMCTQQYALKKYNYNIPARRKFYPRLEEVYRHVFNNSDFNTSHDAFDDTLRCSQIFITLKNKSNLITN